MTYWMAVTDDIYELPIAVGETAKELAAMMRVKKCTIVIKANDYANGKIKYTKRNNFGERYRVVKVKDYEE